VICIVVFVSLVQRVPCCHCSAQHYDGDGGGSVPRKPSMYTSVTVQLVKLLNTCP